LQGTRLRDLAKAEALFTEAKTVSEQGNYQRAIEIYSTILTEWKSHAEVCERATTNLGEVYVVLRKLRPAEKYLKRALGYNPLAPHCHYLLGFIYSVRRQWGRARAEFKVALEQAPQDPEYLRGLGWVLCNCGGTSEGREYLLHALALAPDNVSILTDLALVHMDTREFDKALDYAQRAASIAPTNPLVQLAYGVLAGVQHFADAPCQTKNE